MINIPTLSSNEILWKLGTHLRPPKGTYANTHVIYKGLYRKLMNQFMDNLWTELLKGNTVILPANMGRISIVMRQMKPALRYIGTAKPEEIDNLNGKYFEVEYNVGKIGNTHFWQGVFLKPEFSTYTKGLLYTMFAKENNSIPFYDKKIKNKKYGNTDNAEIIIENDIEYYKNLNNW